MNFFGKDLPAARALEIISSVFPEFCGTSVKLLDEGWDFRVFEVDDAWMFRFPKHEVSQTKLNKEHKLLSGLGEWVSLPIPNYEYFHEPQESSRGAFAGYRKLPGMPGDVSKRVDQQRVAQQIGMFLEKLHTYPVDNARQAGVLEERDLISYWKEKSGEQLDMLMDRNIDQRFLRCYLEKDTPSIYDGLQSLTHNELWAEHILIDPNSGGVSGIIDWGDSIIGDPAIDFACLFAWYGQGYVENIYGHYALKLDEEVLSRARYLGTCLAIHNITLGKDLGRALWVEAGYAALQRIHTNKMQSDG